MSDQPIMQDGQSTETDDAVKVVDPNLVSSVFGVQPVVAIGDSGSDNPNAPLDNGQVKYGNTIGDATIDGKLDKPVVTATDPNANYVKPVDTPKPVNLAQPPVTPKANEAIKPPSTNGQQPPATEQPTVEPEQEWTARENQYISRIQELEDQLVAAKEFEKDPYNFLAKTAPGVMLQKFDEGAYVNSKINEKYGDDFTYDSNEAYRPGTPSYNYRKDVESWEREATNYKDTAQNTVDQQTQQAYDILQEKIGAVKTKYGMDDVTFNQEIWSVLEGMKDSDRLELLADAIMSKKVAEQTIQNVQNATQRINGTPPDITDLNQTGLTSESDDVSKLKRLFGANANGVRVM